MEESIPIARKGPPAPTGDPVRVLCSHDVSLPASALSDAAVADLRRALTKPNPAYVEAERMRRRLYGIPHELCFLREGENLRLPRGAVGILRAVAVRHGYRLDIRSGMTWSPDAKLLPADAPRVPGRPYQIEAEDRLLGIHPGCPGVQGGVVLPCGCLGGDAELVVNRAGKGARMRLDHVVTMFNGGRSSGRTWDATIPTTVQAVDAAGVRRLDRIVAAVSTGTKPVFLVRVEGRPPLRATADHRFLTPAGWARLHELRVGDSVLAIEQGRKPSTPGVPRRGRGDPYYPRLGGMHAHPYATRWWPSRTVDGEQAQVPTHRLVAEACVNGLSFEEFVRRIRAGVVDGLAFLDPKEWTVHHRDRNRRNFDASNLEVIPILEHLRQHGLDESWKNVLPSTEVAKILMIEPLGDEPTFDLTMASEQANYVANGLVVHNSGKTLLGARALMRSGQSGIVLVHTVDLLEQWSQTIARVTGREARVVRNGKGLGPLYPWQVAVAMVQGLRKAGADAAPLLRSAGVILCDEAHHLPAETFYDVVSHCPARYRWWLSATPEREDGLGFVLPWVMGPVLLRRTPEELAVGGYLVLPRVVPVRTGWSPDPYAHYSGHENNGEPRLDWPATSRGIAEDEARNALICRVAAAAARGGRATLVLVQLVEHAERIASQLASQGVRAVPVTGDVAKGHRRKRLEDLRSGRAEVVVATSLADEGLDIPRLSCVVLAAPQRTRGRSQQRIGRLTRPHGDKTAGLAIDLVDGGPMAAQWRRRARAYEDAVGYPPEPFTSVEAVESLLAAARGAF